MGANRRFRRAYERTIRKEDITTEYTAYHYLYVFLRWFRWVPLVKKLSYMLYHNDGKGRVACLVYNKGTLINEKRITINELNLVVAVRLKGETAGGYTTTAPRPSMDDAIPTT